MPAERIGMRDARYSAEGGGVDARDRPAARPGALGDVDAGGDRGPPWPLPEDMNN